MATKVLHGRRRGQERVVTPEFCVQNQQNKPLTDVKQVTVLTKGDWNRIQDQLNRRQIEQERIQRIKAEKEERRSNSKEVIKNWTNTEVGKRLKNLEARKLRQAKEEEERTAIDLEEAKYQAQQRKEAIDKAKTQQYYQTDRVKSFHSALLLTEVLKEREAQLELKQLIAKANDGKDTEWTRLQQHAYEETVQKEQERAAARIRDAKQNEEFLKAQALEHQREKQKEAEENTIEANELKKLAMQYEIEKKQLEEIQRDEKKQQILENRQQLSEMKKMKQIEAQQEEEEDEECRIFAAAKRKMMQLRAIREKEMHEEKQRHLNEIKDKLATQMKEKLDDEDTRILMAVEEEEKKQEEEEAVKQKKMLEGIKAQQEHRLRQLKEEEERKKREKIEMLELQRLRQAADEVFQRNEFEKEKRRLEAAHNLTKHHLDQISELKMLEQQDRDNQLALDKANEELIAVEETQFQEYANKVIKHCQEGGRNVYPLKKAAKEGAGGGLGPVFPGKGGIRPSYMVADKTGVQLPCYKGDSTESTKELVNGKYPTKARVGFVW
ncbi:coiled-coil domain-containing protein 173-like [Gigantopelta aegis]|uniref:coiled-coil domain-containing protein 173-like n=1 Tax=Gigantopelta aegis TaxID=1735272 RepID=UPI001B8883FE|nr:coiled-coil domain-containing protein 173-like [Gigantopelta aegis]